MTVLVIMQNMWIRGRGKDAGFKWDRIVGEAAPETIRMRKRKFIGRLLFMSRCLTSKVILEVFGNTAMNWVYDEASPVVTSKSSGNPPPDPDHVRQAIVDVEPDVILALGNNAQSAVDDAKLCLQDSTPVVYAMHPAARARVAVGKSLLAALEQMRELGVEV